MEAPRHTQSHYAIPVLIPTVVQQVALDFFAANPLAQIHMPRKIGKTSIIIEQIKKDVAVQEKINGDVKKDSAFTTTTHQHQLPIRIIVVLGRSTPKSLNKFKHAAISGLVQQLKTSSIEHSRFAIVKNYFVCFLYKDDDLDYCLSDPTLPVWLYVDEEKSIPADIKGRLRDLQKRFAKIRIIGTSKSKMLLDEANWRWAQNVESVFISD